MMTANADGEETPAATDRLPGAARGSYDAVVDGLLEAGFWSVPDGAVYTCPRCGKTSHNPNDLRYRYCGACHWSEDWGERPQ